MIKKIFSVLVMSVVLSASGINYEPFQEHFEFPDKVFTKGVVNMLEGWIRRVDGYREFIADARERGYENIGIFTCCKEVVGITFEQYVNRFMVRKGDFKLADSCFVVALIYISRIIKKISDENFHPFNQLTFHRIFLSAMMVASKFLQDDGIKLYRFYARVGGVSQNQLFSMESWFLAFIRFELFVSKEEFDAMLMQIKIAGGETQLASS